MLGAVPGVIGSLQVVEAMKLILGIGQPLVGRLLQLDLQNATARIIAIDRRSDCEACSSSVDAAHAPSNDGGETGNAETPDIEPGELAERIHEPALQLLDVREPWEWSIAQIGKPTRTPMTSLPGSLESLDRTRELIVYCHHGTRSEMAAQWLRAQGFRARNLIGGIDRWSREVDPSVPRY